MLHPCRIVCTTPCMAVRTPYLAFPNQAGAADAVVVFFRFLVFFFALNRQKGFAVRILEMARWRPKAPTIASSFSPSLTCYSYDTDSCDCVRVSIPDDNNTNAGIRILREVVYCEF